MKRIWVHTLCAAAVVLLAAASAQAQASWDVVSLDTTGCNSGNIGFTTVVSGITSFPTTLHFHTLVDSGGLRYMDEDAGTPGSNGTYSWHLYQSSSGGPITGTWPIPAGQPITVTFDLADGGATGPVVSHRVITLTRCDGGAIEAGGEAIPALKPPALALLAVLLAVGGAVLLLRRHA